MLQKLIYALLKDILAFNAIKVLLLIYEINYLHDDCGRDYFNFHIILHVQVYFKDSLNNLIFLMLDVEVNENRTGSHQTESR